MLVPFCQIINSFSFIIRLTFLQVILLHVFNYFYIIFGCVIVRCFVMITYFYIFSISIKILTIYKLLSDKVSTHMQNFVTDFPEYNKFFNFKQFNEVQLKCYKPITKDRHNIVVSAPTSSGKTVIFELAIISQMKLGTLKCLYLAPIKSLCHQKFASWHQKFNTRLNIFELTSDTSVQQENDNGLDIVNLVIATPEKIDAYSRKSLDFLSKINLLLVDEVHMLNFQERGATLEAVVSRIMSISNPRIIAVSATIPNIKQVAQWLKVSPQFTMMFGEQYRPVKIHKVVLGFKSSNNPYTFQKLLNYKLTQVIRTYSQEKGVLVFCQTQKGTEMACQQIISDMRQRQFIDSDQTLLALIQGSKRVANTTLQIMIPQGVAFHNAGLSMQDRSVVQKLFLENKIRILCTTSTLAMGINLPARLVVIKSTQCYRGAGKGYQEYTQIQLDQMLGRAGRPPFDTEGTVVIMTQKQNYNKYMSSGKLETLQSHLYGQLCEHLNAEISLRSIKCFKEVLKYFTNSFCYIRMKNSPASYGIKEAVDNYVQRICLQSIKKLDTFNLINYYSENGNIVSRQLGINVARNSIQIDTIIHISKQISKIKTERDFLSLICDSEEIKKYRNKLDERKLLKQLNETNKYTLKNAISTAEKKYYVLIQSELDGRHIQNWELRKQAKQVIYFLRRLTYCVKTVCSEMKLFWPFFWTCLMNKYFTLKFWDRNQQMIIRQFNQLNQKWKILANKGFKNIDHIMSNLHHLDTMCQKNSQFSKKIGEKIKNLQSSVTIKLSPCKNTKAESLNQTESQNFEANNSDVKTKSNQKDILISIKFSGYFDDSFKSIIIIVGQGYELYTIRSLREQCVQTQVAINSSKNYNIAVIKNNFIGFDEFYQVMEGRSIKLIQNVAAFVDVQSNDRINKNNREKPKEKERLIQKDCERVTTQEDDENGSRRSFNHVSRRSLNDETVKQIKGKKKSKSTQILQNSSNTFHESTVEKEAKGLKLKNNKKSLIKSRKKKCNDLSESDDEIKPMKPGTYIPLNQYKCWKPGFRQIESSQHNNGNRLTTNKLMIVDEASSKSKSSLDMDNLATIKSKQSIQWDKYSFQANKSRLVPSSTSPKTNILPSLPSSTSTSTKPTYPEPQLQKLDLKNSSPYNYFLNLFNK